jgi:uncharacterized protein
MLRTVIDPGVLVAARLSGRGAPAEIIRRWLAGELDIVASAQLLDELGDVLARPKFRRWLSLDEAAEYITFVKLHARQVASQPSESGHTRDPDDDHLVTLARSAHVDLLVSGDKDLTSLTSATPPIATPRQLIELLDRVRAHIEIGDLDER